MEKLAKFLRGIDKDNIVFKRHFLERIKDRQITKEAVLKHLCNPKTLWRIEEQPARFPDEEKYKVWFKMSSKYDLVLVISIVKKNLYIITGWNCERRWKMK